MGKKRLTPSEKFKIAINSIVIDFARIQRVEGLIHSEILPPPHVSRALPHEYAGVYIFSYRGIVLKVGKAAAGNNHRWQYDHYDLYSSESNLAASLYAYAHYFTREDPDLQRVDLKRKVRKLKEREIGDWIRQNVDRCNLLVESFWASFVSEDLENFAISRLNPRFEHTSTLTWCVVHLSKTSARNA